MTEMEHRNRSQGKQLDVVARKLNHNIESDTDMLTTEYVVSRGKSGKFLHRMTSSDVDDDDNDDEEENNKQFNNKWKEKIEEMENMDDENKKEYLLEIISKYKTETKTELLLKMIDFLGTSLFHLPECESARDTLLIHGATLNSRITELLCNPTQLLPVRHHSNISYRSNLLRPANQSGGKSSLQTIEYMRKSNEQQKIDRITKNVLKKKSFEDSNENDEESENSFEEVVDLANKEDELDEGQEEDEDEEEVLDINEEVEEEEQQQQFVEISGEEAKLETNEEDDDDEEDDFQYADLMSTENVLTTGDPNQGQSIEATNSVTDLSSLGAVDNKDYFGASDLPSEGVNNAFINDFSVVTTEEEMFAGMDKLDDIMDQQPTRDEDNKEITNALIDDELMDKKRRIYEENEKEKKRRIN